MSLRVLSLRLPAAIMLLCALFISATAHSQTAALPAPPELFEVPYTAQTGATITVNAGGDLQAALDRAQLGDTIVLQAGATFSGSFVLPRKTGSGWVYVQSSAYSNLPAPGTRVTPAHASNMPTLVASIPNTPAIRTAPGAHHYRFVGIRVMPAPGKFVTNLIYLGDSDTSVDTLPSWVVFDRCFVHGDPEVGGRRGIAMDGRYVAVVDSHVSDFKQPGADTQALWAYNTPGPLKIVNNHLEGAGENVMFGGADPGIPNAVPSDIEIRGNHFFKPTSWIGSPWVVKNSLEFKNAQRVVVTRNVFENVWAAGQGGFAIVITPRNQDGRAPWTVVRDISFTYNVITNAGAGFNISATDDIHPSQPTARLLIKNNLMLVSGLNGASGRMFQLLGGPGDVTIDHNTAVMTSVGPQNAAVMVDGGPGERLVFTNNILTRGTYGFFGSGVGEGSTVLAALFPGAVFRKNAFIDGTDRGYPADNFFPANSAAVKFASVATGDYRLAADSPYKNAGTDGRDLGADLSGTALVATQRARPKAPPKVTVAQ